MSHSCERACGSKAVFSAESSSRCKSRTSSPAPLRSPAMASSRPSIASRSRCVDALTCCGTSPPAPPATSAASDEASAMGGGASRTASGPSWISLQKLRSCSSDRSSPSRRRLSKSRLITGCCDRWAWIRSRSCHDAGWPTTRGGVISDAILCTCSASSSRLRYAKKVTCWSTRSLGSLVTVRKAALSRALWWTSRLCCTASARCNPRNPLTHIAATSTVLQSSESESLAAPWPTPGWKYWIVNAVEPGE
mmetsp:Transcript_26585/g.77646  ORF Transcript_26585/g.77646 Transcript_26585/m.77646 type:complete len:250 (+) Transcript_26585:1952-2701(+)